MPPPSEAGVLPRLLTSLNTAQEQTAPYRHWFLHNVLPTATVAAFRGLASDPVGGNEGRRASHNSLRQFCGPAETQTAAWHDLAFACQHGCTIATLEKLTGATLSGSSLRIECCADADGFWLEPHTDIGAKRFTMLIYLNDEPGSESWGTDLLFPDGTLASRAPAFLNTGLIFIPGPDTWHGWAPRPIHGVRRTLIVNYVKPDWQSRHELAFPDRPVAALAA